MLFTASVIVALITFSLSVSVIVVSVLITFSLSVSVIVVSVWNVM